MTAFDLLFLLAALFTFVALVATAVLASRRRISSAVRVLRTWLIGAAAYLVLSLSVSFFRAPTVKSVREPWCFDDWCLTVEATHLTRTSAANTYIVDLLIQSRARRVVQRAKGAWIYLVDERSRRFSPDPDPSAVPLDVVLQPQESVATARTFHLPPDARAIGVITGHGGPYCGPMNFLIIGSSGCLFHKPSMIRID